MERGLGLELLAGEPSTITCLLDRRTSGKTDTRTSRLREKGAGRRGPSFTSQQEMSQTPSKWEGRGGGGALSTRGDKGRRRAPVLSSQREAGWSGRAEVGVGSLGAPIPFCPR